MFYHPDEYARSSVYELLKAASRGWVGVDRRLLKAILDRPEQGLSGLVQFLGEDHSEDPVELDYLLVDLCRHFRAPETLPYLLGLLREYGEDPPEELVSAIQALGEPAVEPLRSLVMEEGASGVQGTAAMVLASLGVRDDRILQTLTEFCRKDPMDGLLAFSVYGDPAARPVIEAIVSELAPSSSEPEELRKECERTLRLLESAAPAAPLLEFDVFADYPDTLGPDFEALSEEEITRFLESPVKEHRVAAALEFFGSEPGGEARKKLLELVSGDPDVEVRASAIRALTECASEEEIHAALRRILQNSGEPAEVRAAAASALAEPKLADFLYDYLIELYAAGGRARWLAMDAMWRTLDYRYRDYMLDHLGDPDPQIRESAILGAGYLGISAACGKLESFFRDEEWRAKALFSYALAVPGDTSPSTVRRLFRKIDKLARGLSPEEARDVQDALDQRLMMHGYSPVFVQDRAAQSERQAKSEDWDE